MSARIPRLVVIAASGFFALAIANSAAADVKSPNPKAPLCDKMRIAACHKACYDAYTKWILGNPKPGQVSKHRKELFQCYKNCKAEGWGAAVAE
jgi:hypothetical protein